MSGREGALPEQVNQHAIEHIFRQMPSVWLGAMLAGLLYVVALWFSADTSLLLPWYAAVTLSLAYLFYLTVAYFRIGARRESSAYWGNALVRAALYQGLLWGGGAFLFLEAGSITNQVVIVTMTLAVSITSIPIGAYWIGTFFAFTLSATGLLAARLVMAGDPEHLLLAVALVLYNLVAASFAWGVSRTLREGVRLRFENLDLVEELSQANQAKSRFLAAASHDLRQPVHSLALFIEALAPEVGSARGKALLDHIHVTLTAHNTLLNSLLDISRLDAGVIEPHLGLFPLQELLDGLDHELRPKAEEKGLQLHLRPCRHAVVSDPTLLSNILRNLIGNAISYTEQGWVLIACRRRGDQVLLQVWDSGPGIPEGEQEAIFEEFCQLANPGRDRSKGLGLGLAICRRLALLLGHELSLHSQCGRGSVFSLSLPKAAPSAVEAPQAVAAMASWELTGRTIMVIDDELLVRQGMASLLGRWGCRVLLAGEVEEAVAQAVCGRIDAIVSDYRLQGEGSGVDAIAALERACGHPIPAMLVTGDTDPARLLDARASGLLLLHKPVAPAQLRAALGELLRRCEGIGDA
jgi:signal transduction histidine kinase